MKCFRHVATGVWLFLLLAGTQSINAACAPLFGGFYQFWQADGNTYDAHGTNNGVLQNGATYATGKVGLAFSFDGVNDFVEVPDNNIYVSGGSFFTIEFWVRFNTVHTGTLAAPGTIFLGNDEGPGNRDKWYFGFGGGKLFFHINTFAGSPQNIAQVNFNPVAGTWYHIAVVRTSFSTYKIYINGVESSSEVNTTDIPNTLATLTIGQAEGTGYLDGQMDEVTIYNVDLTQSELQAIVNAGADGKCRYCATPPSNMTDWWPGNGNALDVQGTNSGTLVGGASFGSAGFVGEAFQFDGVNDAVTTPRYLPYDTFSNMTWECWVFPTRTNFGRQQIISIDDGGFDFSLLIEGNSFAVFTGAFSWIPPNQVVYPFQWQHLAVVFTTTNVEFYLNATRYSLGSPAVYGGSSSTLEFGRNPNQFFGEYFKGMIDEISIYNRPLGAAEILQIYSGANSGKCRVTTAGARIEASQQTLNFGATTIGQTNELTVVVQNTGSATLTNLLTISNAVFSIGSPGTSFTVQAGGSQVVKVRFIPVAATNSAGTLTMTHNDPSRPPVVITLSGVGEPPAVCLPPPSNLVSWWRAENFSGEDARGGNNGALSNGVGFVAGKVGSGFNFITANNYLDAPTNGISIGSADFTVEGWIKAEPGNGNYTIISFGGAYLPTIYLSDTEGRLVMWPRDGAPSGTGFKDGQFHHFAVVLKSSDASPLQYYKDGVLLFSTIAPYPLNGNRCYIGWDQSPGNAFQGVIDELSFYNRALAPAELSAIVAARSAGKCFDPLGNPPDISVTPTNLNFGGVIIGSGATLNLTVSNLGVGPLTINAGTFSNSRFSIAAGTFPLGIAPGAAQTISVQFSPTNLAAQSGTLTLVNNDPDEGNFVVPLTGQGATCPGLPSGGVSWWRADNNALDSIGPNHGTLKFDATYAAGKVGQAFSFDGIEDRVEVPTNGLSFRTGDFTAEGWIKTTSTKDYNAIFTFDSYNPAIYVRYYGAIQLYPSAASTTTGFNDGLFHHFAVVRQSGTVTYYKDGVSAGTAASSTDINPQFTGIGTSTHSAEYFPGQIDELTFYNRSLSGTEIANIFAQGSDGKCSVTNSPGTNNPANGECSPAPGGLISWWRGENSPLDSKGANNGVLSNGTTYATGKVGQGFLFTNRSNHVAAAMNGLNVGNSDFSVEGWIKADSGITENEVIFNFGGPGGYGILLQGNEGLLRFYLANSATSGTGFKDGAFHHFAVVRQAGAGNITYYKDGVNVGTVPNVSANLFQNESYIGWDLDTFTFGRRAFQGVIDEVSFYNRALSSNEVNSIFTTGSGGKCPGTNSVLEVTSTALDFGFVGVGQNSDATLSISNSGNAALNVSNIFSSSARFTVVSPPGSFTVAAGAQQIVTARFTPTAQGLQAGFLAISNSSPDGLFYLPVRGAGATSSRPRGGKVYAWGEIPDGRLGNDFYYEYYSPVPIAVVTNGVLAGKTITAVAASYGHSLALDSDGKVYAWGAGDSGQLGDGTRVDSTSIPVAVTMNGALAGKTVMAIAAGDRHSVALTTDGRVYSWGSGSLGAGFSSLSDVPLAVNTSGVLAGKKITAIAAGRDLTLALASDGKVYSWGDNDYGQLGNSTTNNADLPVAVSMAGALSGKTVVAVAAGYQHGLALTSDGLVFAWGFNADGQLGNNSLTGSSVPVAVDTSGALNGKTVSGIAGGRLQSIAVTSDGRVYDWGYGDEGQLGNGLTINFSNVPVAVRTNGALAGKVAVGITGYDHHMALTSDGKVYSWGDNGYSGLLGTGLSSRALENTNAPMAVDFSGLLARQAVSAMAAGDYHCLIVAAPDPSLVEPEIEFILPRLSLGNVAPGQTLDVGVIVSNAGNAQLTINAVSNTSPYFTLQSGTSFTLAAGAAQAVLVRFAPTGFGVQLNSLCIANSDADEPLAFIPMNGVGATPGATAVAWGDNTYGNIGTGSAVAAIPNPSLVNTGPLAGKSIVMVSGGNKHSVALASDSSIYTWGNNESGQLGNGTVSTGPPLGSNSPVAVNMSGVLAGKTIVAVAAGELFSAALSSDGQVFVWGQNGDGEAGNGSATTPLTAPVAVSTSGVLAGKRVIAIACGSMHMLALTSEGKVFAWGYSGHGQLGNGSYDFTLIPVAVDGSLDGLIYGKTIVAISAGDEHNLALDIEGNLYAWGIENLGVLGIASDDYVPFPVGMDLIEGLAGKRVIAISAGYENNVALTADGKVVSWGDNSYGQLGNGLAAAGQFDPVNSNKPLEAKMNGALAGKSVVAIETGGSDFTLALTSDGQVFSWGANGDGQLGLGTNCVSSCGINEPAAVKTNSALAGRFVIGLGAGSYHSLAVAVPLVPVTNAAPDIDVAPTNVNFGTITVGTTNQVSLGITNVGSALLNVNSMVISNAATFSFIAGSIPFSLNPGEGIVIAVQFRPATLGTHNGSLTIGSNDPDEASLVVSLTGQATASSVPNITVSPGDLNFGTVAVGQTNSLSLQIKNTGAGSLNINSLTVSNAAFSLGLNPAPFNLAAGATTNISVRYHPQTATNFFGTLTIGSSDPDEPSRVVQLSGSTLPSTNITVSFVAWGDNDLGVFGNGGAFSSSVPVPVTTNGALSGKTIVALAAGSYHSLALSSDGKVFGWGVNLSGEIGDGSYSQRYLAVPTLDGALAGRTVGAISAGRVYSLALATDGTVYSWGYNSFGQLGDGTFLTRNAPVAVNTSGALNGKTVIAIAAGYEHNLVLTSDRRIYAWGRNGFGQLGNGGIPTYTDAGNTNVPTAADMTGALNGKTVLAVAAGLNHSLALTSEGKVYAWGYGNYLGNPNYYYVESTVPVPVSTSGVLSGKFIVAIDAGAGFSVALASDGTAYTWGEGDDGQLGNGTTVDFTNLPVAVNMNGVLAGKQLVAIKAGDAHVVAIASDGKMYSWGRDIERELGNGDAPGSNVPVAVDMSGILAGKTISTIAAGSFHNLAIVGPTPTLPVPAVLTAQRTGQTLTLSWSTNLNAQLETTTSLVPPVQWVGATNQVTTVGNQKTVSVQPTGGPRFFRLLVQ